MHRLAFLFVTPAVALAFPLAGLAGCVNGSTTYPPDAGEDGATEPDGSTADTGAPLMGDGGPCLVATSVPADQIPAYATVVQQVGACSAAQISTFVSSCVGSTASPGSCSGFQTASANAMCMGCLFPTGSSGAPTNTGGVLLDYTGKIIVGVNTPGCIALADPSSGPACAAALEPLYQCETQACGSNDCRTSTPSTYQACLTSTTADAGVCTSEDNAAAPCTADFEDGGVGLGVCADDTSAINEICGTGM
jgi:hypothetical protein